MNPTPPASFPRLWRYTAALVVAWTAVTAYSLWWNVREAKRDAQEAALIQARRGYEEDVLYRRWNSLHGGVYAPVTEQTPPNPFLANVPERDIETPSGRKLTLINPAYMTRQVFELGRSEHGIRAHLASLRPVRPDNAADPWETETLQSFERGATERHQVQVIDGREYLRFMRPLVTEQSCLACHASQGYKVGDIRGGVVVAVPLQALSAIARQAGNRQELGHLVLWLLGIGGLTLGTARLRKADRALLKAHDTLEQRVRERTAQLRESLEASRRSEERYQGLYEHVPVMNFTLDRAGTVLAVNRYGAQQLGYSVQELVGKPALDVIHSEDRTAVRRQLKECLERPAQVFEWELRKVHKGGHILWVHETARVMQEEDGPVLLIACRDITEHKQAAEELLRHNEELAALNALGRKVSQSLSVDEVVEEAVEEMVEASQAGVGFVFLRKGEALTLAGIGPQSAAQQFGEVPEHRVGECMCGLAVREGRPLFSRDIFSDVRCTWEECKRASFRSFAALPLRSGEDIIGVVGLACREERDFEPQATFLETLASQVAVGLRNALLHQEVQRHARELEQRVVARTAQLAAKNEDLKGFAYTVSHDLKAPLRGIAGYAQELERHHKTGLAERALFCIMQIITATRNLDRLIDDLLQYSRLDAEAPSLADVNLRGLVEAILKDRSLVIAEQHIEVTVDIPFTTLWTWERGLVQVLTNVIDNALKYSRDAGPPRLGIRAEALGNAWRLVVSDNGIGFDMKYHDRIFGLFNRLVRTDEFEGTGAGLAIVKKVVEKLGGTIRAESAPGQGATFIVELPNQPTRPSTP